MTLLNETLHRLADHDKTPADVWWVGSADGEYAISWEEFEKISQVSYDSGFGAQHIATDLVVVGDGWWMERGEYGGSEWWEFKSAPVKQTEVKAFSNVGGPGIMWDSISELNTPEVEELEAVAD